MSVLLRRRGTASSGTDYVLIVGGSSGPFDGDIFDSDPFDVGAAGASRITLTGGSVSLTYTPFVSVPVDYVVAVQPGTITLSGGTVGIVYTPAGVVPETPTAPEVWWPVEVKNRQREALGRYLIEERERVEREAREASKPQPSKRAVKRAVERVIERVRTDGILSRELLSEARSGIQEAIASTRSIDEILAGMRFVDGLIEAATRQQFDDEAALILLLAA